jgi:hypothetical protein
MYKARTSTDYDYVVFLSEASKSIVILNRAMVKDKISKYLNISIWPEDVKNHSINLNAVKRFILQASIEMIELLKKNSTNLELDQIQSIHIKE